ncbi:peptidoglycan editing factor PgeF [Caulobacter sp. KR2-114]|uniref:peptidoglycan editing factor PgeF n=1 Tax=Caulobacter sp. KR2-114 TaxID=3400912 RepID=UPI003C07B3B7
MTASDLQPIQSALLASAGVRHGFFSRLGGVSDGLYASLNVGRGSGDDPAAVAENRRRAAAVFDAGPEALNVCYQIHSARALVADRPWGDERPQADAVVTATPGVVCGALAADCAPVLLADVEAGVVASAHAGWKGALGGVVEAAVAAMAGLGARPGRIIAAVGPCIAQPSYEVGLEFLQAFAAEDAAAARFFAPGQSADKRQFDLPGYVLARLARAGVARAEWVGHDTCAEEALFFSNRRAFRRGEADYGRLLSAISL